jgi:chromosome partitioning protein
VANPALVLPAPGPSSRTLARSTAIHDLIAGDAKALSAKLQAHRQNLFPPAARKQLRRFTSGEAARLIGVDDGYLRRLSLDGKGPLPEISPNGRRSYSIEDIQALRAVLDETAKTGRRYQRHRRAGEHLQVIAVVNFKGGSGKTTTSAHLAQHLALQGVPGARRRPRPASKPFRPAWLSARV